jgi:hypothetical protein
MKSSSASKWVKAYDHIHQELTSKGFKPKLQTLDNEASAASKSFFTTNDVKYIVADLLAENTRTNARGPYGARLNCPHWPVEKATFFNKGTNITSGMKQQLASQLLDGKLHHYIIDKEKWSQYTFDRVAWSDYEMAFKRFSKNRQVNISKACFNLWRTGRKNVRYYGGKKGCCMCNTPEEDWIHILTCP